MYLSNSFCSSLSGPLLYKPSSNSESIKVVRFKEERQPSGEQETCNFQFLGMIASKSMGPLVGLCVGGEEEQKCCVGGKVLVTKRKVAHKFVKESGCKITPLLIMACFCSFMIQQLMLCGA